MKNRIVKTIVLVSVMGLMSYSSMAQNKEPLAVSNAFSARYPSAKLKGWKMIPVLLCSIWTKGITKHTI